ncbi:ribonuclease H-like domain-containing protein [Tanacetum coccineum]
MGISIYGRLKETGIKYFLSGEIGTMMAPSGSFMTSFEDFKTFLPMHTPLNDLIRTSTKKIGIIPEIMSNVFEKLLVLLSCHSVDDKIPRMRKRDQNYPQNTEKSLHKTPSHGLLDLFMEYGQSYTVGKVPGSSTQRPNGMRRVLAGSLERIWKENISYASSLQYLTFTRPDISYAVQQVCLHMHDPREPHYSDLKRILRYVCGTLDYGLQLFSSTTLDLVAYSDADWTSFPTTRRSTSGYCVFLDNNLLSWSSKRQPMLSRSSAEAEYRGVTNAVAETYWLRNLLRELHTPLSSATLVYCDNVSAVYLSCNPVQPRRQLKPNNQIYFTVALKNFTF